MYKGRKLVGEKKILGIKVKQYEPQYENLYEYKKEKQLENQYEEVHVFAEAVQKGKWDDPDKKIEYKPH